MQVPGMMRAPSHRGFPVWFFVALFFLMSNAMADEISPWDSFKARFVTSDGRVVDTGNKNISHTEGQGYAMLAAATFDDQATFRLLWTWTKTHLPRRSDGLFPWRWTPDAGGGSVTDGNNASDGDLLLAWALARGAERWRDPTLRQEASSLAQAILTTLVRTVGGKVVLLPGAVGFVHDHQVTLNLSYWVFPAFADLDRVASSPLWAALRSSGFDLLGIARFGRHQLPVNWIDLSPDETLPLSQRITPAPAWPASFGYDAIRVPLYVGWLGGTSDALTPIIRYWLSYPSVSEIPAEINVLTDAVTPYPLSAGGRALVSQTLRWQGKIPASTDMGGNRASDDYYSSALLLMTRVAAAEHH